ncbi:MAG: hypothetical protein ACI3X1_00125 [Eubacteriales bacterium]
MTQENQIISKGNYGYSQIDDFIAVKDYIFTRSQGKKCLFLRFTNYADYVVNSMSFTLIQINSSGEDLGHIEINCSKLDIRPGQSYAYDNGIVVSEYCSDFKVVFTSVRSENYIYTVCGGRVAVRVDLPPQALISGTPAKKSIHKAFSVTRRSFERPRLSIFLATVMLILMLALNVAYVLYTYIDAILDEREKLEQEAETDYSLYEDREPGIYKQII